jgi:hypothetical protein
MTTAPDLMLRRIERGALVWCVGVAALALVWSRDWSLGLGILGGGLLTAVSLYAIRSSVDALIALMTPSEAAPEPQREARRTAAGAVVRLAGRYALLAVMAYAMIARLRLHPIGLLIGASSLVASAALEAVRVLTRARFS